MDVNSTNLINTAYEPQKANNTQQATNTQETQVAAQASQTTGTSQTPAAVYEPSKDSDTNEPAPTRSVAQLMQDDMDARTKILRDIVEKLLTEQSAAAAKSLAQVAGPFAQMCNQIKQTGYYWGDSADRLSTDGKNIDGSLTDIGTDQNIYDLLRTGKVSVDAKTKAQAQEDVSEKGYYGVEQTSDRLLSFAKALTGNDASKADLMIGAIKEGFAAAQKTWGGELPEISQKTLDASIKKIEDWRNESMASAAADQAASQAAADALAHGSALVS